jgi:hypothetical protein
MGAAQKSFLGVVDRSWSVPYHCLRGTQKSFLAVEYNKLEVTMTIDQTNDLEVARQLKAQGTLVPSHGHPAVLIRTSTRQS